MTRASILAALLIAPASAQADFLLWRFDLVETGLETVLTNPFNAPGPTIDVYHFVGVNPNPAPATSIELNLRGPFLNNFTFSQLGFQDSTDLPAPGGVPVAESFFVTPPGTVGIGRDDIDDANGVLSAAYTIQGGAEFVPAGGEAVLAVLSVPTGAGLLSFSCNDVSGFAVIDGELAAFFPCPEPATALLAALALVGVAARRW